MIWHALPKFIITPLAAITLFTPFAHHHHVHHQETQHHAATPPPAHSFNFFDSASPGNLPPGAPAVAVYANGPYQASSAQVAGKSRVIWIDTNGSDPHAKALDIEPGDAVASQAGPWAAAHVAQTHTPALIYNTLSEWSAVRQSVSQEPASVQADTQYWIADPTGIPHIVPGSVATQWAWNGIRWDADSATGGF